MKSQRIIKIQPCTENGMVTLEVDLNPNLNEQQFFDPKYLCENLTEAPYFENTQCSEELGYARLNYKGKRLHIFNSGKIIIRRADNHEDAINALRLVILAAIYSIRCHKCGKLFSDCLSDNCNEIINNLKDISELRLEHIFNQITLFDKNTIQNKVEEIIKASEPVKHQK